MTIYGPNQAKEKELEDVELAITRQPEAATLYLERARLLSELGRNQEAREEYLRILNKDPMNFIAMNNLGTLLFSMGFRAAARTAYEAVAQRQRHPIAHINLGNMLRDDGKLQEAREHYEKALELSSSERAKAHQGLAYILLEQGDDDGAAKHRQLGFEGQSVIIGNFRGKAEPIKVLLLSSGVGGNVPTHTFMDEDIFLGSIIVVEYFDQNTALPEHHIIFNAIGDVELVGPALDIANDILKKTTAPIINRPDAVKPTSRAGNAERLKSIPGLVTPKIKTFPRAEITPEGLARHGFQFPVLLRRLGFHGGSFFEKADSADQLAEKLAIIKGEELTVIEYIDYSSADGNFRKYRVMMIDGELFPLHAAISSSKWKLHYFSGDMKDNQANREEDKKFLEDMPGYLGTRVMQTLADIQKTIGLEYMGIDFGINQAGDVVLFETNATMVVPTPGHEDIWNYRRPPVWRILEAVRNMIYKRLPAEISAKYVRKSA